MKKSEFITKLNERLSILTDDERKDIIDEYSEYIDNKISEGKTEEEAVRNFGDIDELASEILKAYKINDKYSKKENFKSEASEILNDITTFLTTTFNSAFSGISTQGISSMIVLILTAIILCILLRIPFWLIELLGNILLSILLPHSLEWIFVKVWDVIVLCFYFLTAIIMIKNLFVSGQQTSSESNETKKKVNIIMPNKKDKDKKVDNMIIDAEVVSETSRSENIDETATEENDSKKNDLKDPELKLTEVITDDADDIVEVEDIAQEVENDLEDTESEFEEIESEDEEDSFDEIKKDFIPHTPKKKKLTLGSIIMKCIKLTLQLFAVLCIIPFILIMVALVILFGCEIYLLILGSSIVGITLLTVAGIIFITEFASLIWKALVGSKRKMVTYLGSIIVFALLLGVGTIVTISEFANYKIEPNPLITTGQMSQKTSQYEIYDDTSFWLRTQETTFEIDDTLSDNQVVIDYYYPQDFYARVSEVKDHNEYYYYTYLDTTELNEIKYVQKSIKTIFNGLKKNTLYQMDSYSSSKAVVYMNQNMFDNALDESYYEGFLLNYMD